MGLDDLLDLSVQGSDLLYQSVSFGHLDRRRLRPLVEGIHCRALLLAQGGQRLFGASAPAHEHAEPVAPELSHNLMGYPETFTQAPQDSKKIVSSRLIVAVQVQQDISVEDDKSRLQRGVQLVFPWQVVTLEVVIDAAVDLFAHTKPAFHWYEIADRYGRQTGGREPVNQFVRTLCIKRLATRRADGRPQRSI